MEGNVVGEDQLCGGRLSGGQGRGCHQGSRGAARRGGAPGGWGPRRGLPGGSRGRGAAGTLRLPHRLPGWKTRGPGAPQPFPSASSLPLSPAGVASPRTSHPVPTSRFPPLPAPSLSSSPDPCPALPTFPVPFQLLQDRGPPGPPPPWPPVPVTSCPAPQPPPRAPCCPRTLAPARPGPALTPMAALQSQAGSEAAAEPIHGPWSARSPLPGRHRPRPPVRDLRGLDTFTFTRGEDEGTGPGRGSAPSGLRPNPRRTWAGPLFPGPQAGRRGVTEGARRASGRGGATSLPPSLGRPGKLGFPSPEVPKRAGSPRSHPLSPQQAGECPSGGHPCTFQVAPGLLPERDKVFRVGTPFQPLHLSPCNCFSLGPFLGLLSDLCFSPMGHPSLRCPFPYSISRGTGGIRVGA